jgi:signal transduction histidine kinase
LGACWHLAAQASALSRRSSSAAGRSSTTAGRTSVLLKKDPARGEPVYLGTVPGWWDFAPADWLPPAALAAVAAWELPTASTDHVRGPFWAVAAVLAFAIVALVWRRRRPLIVLGLVIAALTVPAVRWGTPELTSGVLALVFALFAAARYAARPRAYLAIPMASAAALAATALDPAQPALSQSWGWALNSIWIFALGAWIRQKQAIVDRTENEAAARARAAAAEERLGIARDLHDLLAHSLAVMVVQAEAADAVLDADTELARRAITEVSGTGREALAQVRRVVTLLRDVEPSGVASAPPVPGLADLTLLVERVRSSGVPVVLEVSAVADDVSDEVGRAAYGVVQEALTNVLRHAGPVATQVRLSAEGSRLLLDVVNSPGCLVGTPAGTPGHGLIGMRERVHGVGGTVQSGGRADGGYAVHADLPRRSRFA